jgi:hypothetical protein
MFQSSSQNSYSETRNSHCKGALVNDMAATTHICQTSVNPVHYAQVCYFNNVWLMFLVF